MKKRKHNILTFVIMLALTLSAPSLCANKIDKNNEYQLKAVFLFNFIKFTSWPGKKNIKGKTSPPAPIYIGVVGDAPFGNSFDIIIDQKIHGRPIKVEWIPGLKENQRELKDPARLQKCHVLYITISQMRNTAKFVETVKGHNVLTVGEYDNCLDEGGMINLITEKKKITFEVNLPATKKEKLQIRSKLLRLAKRIIKK